MILVEGSPVFDARSRAKSSDVLKKLLEHPQLISRNKKLRSSRIVSIKPPKPSGDNGDENYEEFQPSDSKVVYVLQKEYATVSSEAVQFVGTDDVTTCVGLVIRNPETRSTSVGHFDRAEYAGKGVNQVIASHNATEPTTFQVHLIGAYDDSRDHYDESHHLDRLGDNKKQSQYSLPLTLKIINALQKSKHSFEMGHLCILQHNTVKGYNGYACPAVRGLVVETKSGDVKSARFEQGARGPDFVIRSVCTITVTSDPHWDTLLLSPYQTQTDSFVIKPSKWSRVYKTYAPYMLSLTEEEFLQTYSTSPYAEGPDFVDNCKRVFKYMLEFPDWRRTFPEGKPRVFRRTEEGGWAQAVET